MNKNIPVSIYLAFTEKLRRNFLDAESWKLSVAQCSGWDCPQYGQSLFEVMFEFFNPHDFMKYFSYFNLFRLCNNFVEKNMNLHKIFGPIVVCVGGEQS